MNWLHERGYKIDHHGEGHIHILSGTVSLSHGNHCYENEVYNYEINACYSEGWISARGSGVERRLDMADPDFFRDLEKIFPRLPKRGLRKMKFKTVIGLLSDGCDISADGCWWAFLLGSVKR